MKAEKFLKKLGLSVNIVIIILLLVIVYLLHCINDSLSMEYFSIGGQNVGQNEIIAQRPQNQNVVQPEAAAAANAGSQQQQQQQQPQNFQNFDEWLNEMWDTMTSDQKRAIEEGRCSIAGVPDDLRPSWCNDR